MARPEAWTAGMLDGWIRRRFGPAAPAVRIWAQDCLAAGFAVAVYVNTAERRHELFPYPDGELPPHRVVPSVTSAGQLRTLRLVAECRPEQGSNVVPLPLAAGSGR